MFPVSFLDRLVLDRPIKLLSMRNVHSSIQPAAAILCLPVWVLFPGGCRFPCANFCAGSRAGPTTLLYKCLGPV